jgi:hypothetical protein
VSVQSGVSRIFGRGDVEVGAAVVVAGPAAVVAGGGGTFDVAVIVGNAFGGKGSFVFSVDVGNAVGVVVATEVEAEGVGEDGVDAGLGVGVAAVVSAVVSAAVVAVAAFVVAAPSVLVGPSGFLDIMNAAATTTPVAAATTSPIHRPRRGRRIAGSVITSGAPARDPGSETSPDPNWSSVVGVLGTSIDGTADTRGISGSPDVGVQPGGGGMVSAFASVTRTGVDRFGALRFSRIPAMRAASGAISADA